MSGLEHEDQEAAIAGSMAPVSLTPVSFGAGDPMVTTPPPGVLIFMIAQVQVTRGNHLMLMQLPGLKHLFVRGMVRPYCLASI